MNFNLKCNKIKLTKSIEHFVMKPILLCVKLICNLRHKNNIVYIHLKEVVQS